MKLTDLLSDVEKATSDTVRYEFDENYVLDIKGKEHSLKGQWIDLYPFMSNEYQKHLTETNRNLAGMEKEMTGAEREREMFAGMIKAWSFNEEPTHKNKVAALKLFGQTLILELVQKANTVNFTKAKPKISRGTQKS